MVDFLRNDNLMIENLSIKKGMKEIIKEGQINYQSRSPLFKSMVIDMERLMSSKHKVKKKIDFNYNCNEDTNTPIELKSIKVHFDQCLINCKENIPTLSNVSISNINTKSYHNTKYILGKTKIMNQLKVIKIKKNLDSFYSSVQKDPQQYYQTLLGDLN